MNYTEYTANAAPEELDAIRSAPDAESAKRASLEPYRYQLEAMKATAAAKADAIAVQIWREANAETNHVTRFKLIKAGVKPGAAAAIAKN